MRIIAILFAILFCAPAYAALYTGSGDGAGTFVPPQAALAATWGYNNLVFDDEFTTTGTIDVNNTLNPGYNWLVTNIHPGNTSTLLPSIFSITTPSILNFTQSTANTAAWMVNASAKTTTTYYGRTLTATGWYAEMRFSLSGNSNPNQGNPVNGSEFNWWFMQMDNSLAQAYSFNAGHPCAEVDVFEWGLSSSNSLYSHVLNWTSYNSTTEIGGYDGSSAAIDLTQYHTLGFLWVPTTKNSGTGIIQVYLDGVILNSAINITYTNPSTYYSAMESSTLGYQMLLGYWINGYVSPFGFNVDYVRVWQ